MNKKTVLFFNMIATLMLLSHTNAFSPQKARGDFHVTTKHGKYSDKSLKTVSLDPSDFSRQVWGLKTKPVSEALNDGYQWYLNSIDENPIITKGVTAAVVGSVGDVLGQWITATSTGMPFVLDVARVHTFFLCGLLFIGPYIHTFYEQLWKLGRFMERKYQSPKSTQTLAQVFVDQTVGVLMFFSTYFYVYEVIDSLVSHRVPNFNAATLHVQSSLSSVLTTNLYVWPLTNFINFGYVPEKLRVLVNNVVGILWNAYLCTIMAG